MKLATLALSASLLGFMSLSPASAAPAPSSALKQMSAQDSRIVQTQYAPPRKAHRNKAYRKGYRKGYRAGHRYQHAPRGWKRYGARPYGWQSRGCVIVGPVWFCP